MKNKTSIILCMGSSCFTRGNNKTLEILKTFIESHPLRSEIDFRGQLCSGNCKHGPIIKIDGKVHNDINSTIAVKLIEEHLKSKYS